MPPDAARLHPLTTPDLSLSGRAFGILGRLGWGQSVRLTVRILGLDLLAVELATDTAEEEDLSRDLSGGNLASDRIEAGPTDFYMGFTGGREVSDDD